MRQHTPFRVHFYVIVSFIYAGLGLVIIARSVLSNVLPLAIFGLVLLGLGIVRLRDYYRDGVVTSRLGTRRARVKNGK
jgi:hypothetical protein